MWRWRSDGGPPVSDTEHRRGNDAATQCPVAGGCGWMSKLKSVDLYVLVIVIDSYPAGAQSSGSSSISPSLDFPTAPSAMPGRPHPGFQRAVRLQHRRFSFPPGRPLEHSQLLTDSAPPLVSRTAPDYNENPRATTTYCASDRSWRGRPASSSFAIRYAVLTRRLHIEAPEAFL